MVQMNTGETELVLPSGKSTTHTAYRLERFEDLGKSCDTQSQWQSKLKSELQVGLDNSPWIADEGLRNFFKREGSMDKEDRLSASVGLGVY
jgi:hypothetical protein